MSKLYAISGRLNVGKSEAANILSELTGFKQIAFADKLKERIALTWNIDRTLLEDRAFKSQISPVAGYTWRELMQEEGEAMRRMYSNYWVDALFSGLIFHPSAVYVRDNYYKGIIVPDVRHINEAYAIEKRGGIIIRLERDEIEQDSHISETELDDYPFDIVIRNNGSKEELKQKLIEVI